MSILQVFMLFIYVKRIQFLLDIIIVFFSILIGINTNIFIILLSLLSLCVNLSLSLSTISIFGWPVSLLLIYSLLYLLSLLLTLFNFYSLCWFSISCFIVYLGLSQSLLSLSIISFIVLLIYILCLI